MNRNIGAIPRIPELNKRLLFTALMLIIYRLGVFVPLPGIDPEQIVKLFEETRGTIFDILNMFSGGALERASVFALGVMPYITSSIIMSLLVKAFPSLEAMKNKPVLPLRNGPYMYCAGLHACRNPGRGHGDRIRGCKGSGLDVQDYDGSYADGGLALRHVDW